MFKKYVCHVKCAKCTAMFRNCFRIMATFKTVVQNKRADGYYVVYIRLTHNRKVIYLKTDKMVNDKGITSKREVKDTFVLNSCLSTITGWIDKLNKVDHEKWTAEQVRDYLLQDDEDISFSDFSRSYIETLRGSYMPNSIKRYEAALHSLEMYANTTNIKFSELTTNFITSWIDSMKDSKRIKMQYPILIKRLFNEGVKNYNDYDTGLMRIKRNPWMKVEIPKAVTPEKKAITMEDCRSFFALRVDTYKQQQAIDICKMIFCLAGINTADLFNMKKEDYYDGIIHYERKKTRNKRADKAYIEMRVPDMLIPTFVKYATDEKDKYLFNFHRNYCSTESLSTSLSANLHYLCTVKLGMTDHIYTPYTFRHTWATIAQNDVGASYEEIGFALNHISTHKVTMGYVKPDFTRAWELNEKVIEKVFFTNEKSKRLSHKVEKTIDIATEVCTFIADAYFMGEVVAHVDGKGYKNTDEIIDQLMANINDNVPSTCTIQIKVKNITKDQTKYFERMRDKK